MLRTYSLPVLLLAVFLSTAVSEDDAARQAYLAKRAAEKAAAEQAVKELSARDYATLSADEFIRLSYAYSLATKPRSSTASNTSIPSSSSSGPSKSSPSCSTLPGSATISCGEATSRCLAASRVSRN